MGVKAVQVKVQGRVQGVGFRWMASHEARSLGLAGWVQNCLDGSVEVWVEGQEDAVDSWLDWVRGNPGYARVRSVDVNERVPSGATKFEVRI